MHHFDKLISTVDFVEIWDWTVTEHVYMGCIIKCDFFLFCFRPVLDKKKGIQCVTSLFMNLLKNITEDPKEISTGKSLICQ